MKEIPRRKGEVLAASAPVTAGKNRPRCIDPRNAFLMDTMLRDVTIYGTAARASVALKRHDLAGKTGTTNEYVDAWFCGYQMTVAGCAWVGFDQPEAGRQGNRGRRASHLDRLHEPRPARRPGQPAGSAGRAGGPRQRPRPQPMYSENAAKEAAGEEQAAGPCPSPNSTSRRPTNQPSRTGSPACWPTRADSLANNPRRIRCRRGYRSRLPFQRNESRRPGRPPRFPWRCRGD